MQCYAAALSQRMVLRDGPHEFLVIESSTLQFGKRPRKIGWVVKNRQIQFLLQHVFGKVVGNPSYEFEAHTRKASGEPLYDCGEKRHKYIAAGSDPKRSPPQIIQIVDTALGIGDLLADAEIEIGQQASRFGRFYCATGAGQHVAIELLFQKPELAVYCRVRKMEELSSGGIPARFDYCAEQLKLSKFHRPSSPEVRPICAIIRRLLSHNSN